MYKQFLKAGYPVFSIRPIIDGKCSCGECKKAGKHPYDKGWENTPVWSDEKLEEQERRGRMANYGVLVKGLLVVDIDPKNGGTESFNKLKDLIPEILNAGLVVETGGGGFHYYFKASGSFRQILKEFPGIDFKSSGYVIGPGSGHLSGKKYVAQAETHVDAISDAPAELFSLLARPDAVETDGKASLTELAAMLERVDPDCEEPTWRLIGGAIHHLTGGSQDGFQLFDYWSSQGDKYGGWQECMDKWKRYGTCPNPAGLGTLRYLAKEGGYEEPVTYVSETDWGFVEGHDPVPETSVETPDHIDLQRPPGFVGQITEWINSQCPKPRERLAAVAALVAVGNVAGLQYEDDMRATSNLFAICIASSGSGKNAVKNAISTIQREAGMGRVTYGKSKSAQEIYRSLISHQQCLFNIDELGIKFQAIANATKSGASYYETWFAEMMSIYSNADGTVDLQEDEYREIEKKLASEIAFCRERIDNNEDPSGKFKRMLEKAENRLKGDLALVRPFLSMIGYSTPERFDAMVTPDRVTEGFIGRCLIVREPIDVVKRKAEFDPKPLPDRLKNTVWMLASGGRAGEDVDVLANDGARIRIRTSAEAKDELKRVRTLMEELEEHYEEVNGMHAIPTRAEELILKVSFILAIPEGVRSLEHVQWATAFVLRDIETKIALAMGNSKATDALENKILANLAKDEWVTLAQLRNRCRPIATDKLLVTLAKMTNRKMIQHREREDKRSAKRMVDEWKL